MPALTQLELLLELPSESVIPFLKTIQRFSQANVTACLVVCRVMMTRPDHSFTQVDPHKPGFFIRYSQPTLIIFISTLVDGRGARVSLKKMNFSSH